MDQRRPAVVTEAFHRTVAGTLAPIGFEARAKGNLVRRRGRNKHRIVFSSSHRNVEGYVVCWVAFGFEDHAVRARHPGWTSGGVLNGHLFDPELTDSNVANPLEADALLKLISGRLSYFDLLESPARVLADVSRRYVPGFVEPSVIVPYLGAHLGPEAVVAYAQALLRGRPELWPAFAYARERPGQSSPTPSPDHGTQLANALIGEGVPLTLAVPADVVPSADPRAAALRCFFGRQLRAWGEPDAAAALRQLADADVRALYVAIKGLDGP